jgi:hypothetical protein
VPQRPDALGLGWFGVVCCLDLDLSLGFKLSYAACSREGQEEEKRRFARAFFSSQLITCPCPSVVDGVQPLGASAACAVSDLRQQIIGNCRR